MERVGESDRRPRKQPKIVIVDGEKRISSGRWNDQCVAQYVIDEAYKKWKSTTDLARLTYSSGPVKNQKLIRARLRSLSKTLLAENRVLLIDYTGPHMRAEYVKVYNPTLEEDRQQLMDRVAVQEAKGDLLREEAAKVRAIFEGMRVAA